MTLADVDLQIVHRLRMALVKGQRTRSKSTSDPIDDDSGIPFDGVANGAGKYGEIGGGVQIYGPPRFSECRPVLKERRVDGAEVDEHMGVGFPSD